MIFITFHYRYRKQIIIGIIIFILIGSITTFTIINLKDKPKDNDLIVVQKKIKKKETKKEIKEEYQVDIKGEIASPGIYKVNSDLRVMDVIMKAGGLTEQADTSVINLSKKVQDEMVIIIYSRDEVSRFREIKEIEKQVNDKCNKPTDDSLVNNACIEESTNTPSKVSINNASLEELMNLPGIGESKAKDIINYRETNGPFTSIEDLLKIKGIGESILAKIKENITL